MCINLFRFPYFYHVGLIAEYTNYTMYKESSNLFGMKGGKKDRYNVLGVCKADGEKKGMQWLQIWFHARQED